MPIRQGVSEVLEHVGDVAGNRAVGPPVGPQAGGFDVYLDHLHRLGKHSPVAHHEVEPYAQQEHGVGPQPAIEPGKDRKRMRVGQGPPASRMGDNLDAGVFGEAHKRRLRIGPSAAGPGPNDWAFRFGQNLCGRSDAVAACSGRSMAR